MQLTLGESMPLILPLNKTSIFKIDVGLALDKCFHRSAAYWLMMKRS